MQKTEARPVLQKQSISTDKPTDFILDHNGILRKIVRLKYIIQPTIVIPKSQT